MKLSPFLFVMLMSVIMNDAVENLEHADKAMYKKGLLATLLYADDTLPIGVSDTALQRLLEAVAEAGASCGLELHWDKFQLISVRCDHDLRTPAGVAIQPKASLAYLGVPLSADGRLGAELAKRLGVA